MTHNKERVLLIVLFLIGILIRLPFMEKMQSHWDAPDWSIAIIRYSFVQETPSPPGYPLYIAFGKIMNIFFKDLHTAIVMVSVFFSGIGAVVYYVVGKQLFNKQVGIISSIIFLSAPTLYFFGITANPYSVLAISAAVLGYIVYKIVFKNYNSGLLLGLVFSFAVGLRPQDVMFLLPVTFLGFVYLHNKQRIIFALSFITTFLLWLIPTAYAVGGLSAYFQHLHAFVSTGVTPDISWERLSEIWFVLLRGFYLTLGIASIGLVFYVVEFSHLYKTKNFLHHKTLKIIAFYILWLAPSFLFNVFIRSDHAAHQMTYLAVFIFLTAYALWRMTRRSKVFFYSCMLIIVLFNLFTFFRDRDPDNKRRYVDQSYHYSEIRKNDVRLKSKVDFITDRYSPKDTILLTTPTMWRPYMYYFKEYKLYEIDALDTKDQRFIHRRRDAQYWNKKEYEKKVHTFTTPHDIRYIIILGDDEEFVIRNTRSMKYDLDAGSFIYTIPVQEAEVFSYGYHSLAKQ